EMRVNQRNSRRASVFICAHPWLICQTQNKKYVAPDRVRGLRICRVMGKALIIAEKPSVASDISRALGKFQKHQDYFENDEYVISSAVGHLLTIVPPPGV